MPGCRYEQTPNLSQIVTVNISHGLFYIVVIQYHTGFLAPLLCLFEFYYVIFIMFFFF